MFLENELFENNALLKSEKQKETSDGMILAEVSLEKISTVHKPEDNTLYKIKTEDEDTAKENAESEKMITKLPCVNLPHVTQPEVKKHETIEETTVLKKPDNNMNQIAEESQKMEISKKEEATVEAIKLFDVIQDSKKRYGKSCEGSVRF